MSRLNNCIKFNIPGNTDSRGSLCFIENKCPIPFEIQRVYWLYDINDGMCRGGHAHKELHQIMVPISGSFNIKLFDGHNKKVINLNSPSIGLYICPMIWRELFDFSSNAVCMVLASQRYTESDYYRNITDFINQTGYQ